ncbi:MAG: hypothetical protein PVI43_01030 [Candidatus Bathyarchaeota archaeon]|jgi:hypothetical protein
MEKLADFTLVEKVFEKTGITPNWLYALANGYTKVYDDYGIVNYCMDGEVCVINSGTIDNGRFTIGMKRDIIGLGKAFKKCIIYSERHEIKRFMNKLGYRHDEEKNLYIKGL